MYALPASKVSHSKTVLVWGYSRSRLCFHSGYIKSIFWKTSDSSLLIALSKLPLVSSSTHLSSSISPFVFPPLFLLSLSLPVSVVCVITWPPGQQGSSFLPVCLLLLSSFTSWLDHQPCKEDLWPWSTQNGICWALGTRWEARCICSQQVSHTKFKPFVLVLTTVIPW